jgi:hypothetical protein
MPINYQLSIGQTDPPVIAGIFIGVKRFKDHGDSFLGNTGTVIFYFQGDPWVGNVTPDDNHAFPPVAYGFAGIGNDIGKRFPEVMQIDKRPRLSVYDLSIKRNVWGYSNGFHGLSNDFNERQRLKPQGKPLEISVERFKPFQSVIGDLNDLFD